MAQFDYFLHHPMPLSKPNPKPLRPQSLLANHTFKMWYHTSMNPLKQVEGENCLFTIQISAGDHTNPF